jgi:hypothetical protein
MINSAPIPISTGLTTQMTGWGFQITGGASPIAMTTGASAVFDVRKVNVGGFDLIFGQSGQTASQFGVRCYGQKHSDGTIDYLQLYNCKAFGFPISFKEKAWSEYSVTVKALYDSPTNAVGWIGRVRMS